jgi:hypothetical protein
MLMHSLSMIYKWNICFINKSQKRIPISLIHLLSTSLHSNIEVRDYLPSSKLIFLFLFFFRLELIKYFPNVNSSYRRDLRKHFIGIQGLMLVIRCLFNRRIFLPTLALLKRGYHVIVTDSRHVVRNFPITLFLHTLIYLELLLNVKLLLSLQHLFFLSTFALNWNLLIHLEREMRTRIQNVCGEL